MTAYIVRGVPPSILKDGWWLADTSTEPNNHDNSPKLQVFWKGQKTIPTSPRPK